MRNGRVGVTLCIALTAAALWLTRAEAATLPPVIRGGRAIMLLPDRGELTVKIYKQDLNIYAGADVLTATLVGPQRQPLGELSIPDDGNAEKGGGSGELQSAEMTVNCDAPGVYRLSISTSSDAVFGMETNCDSYVLEGDMMLNDGSIFGRVFFEPPAEAFTITAQALHSPGRQQMPLADAAGQTLNTFDLSKTGEDQEFTVPADIGNRDGVWHFEIAKCDVRITVPGVKVWSMEQGAYFDASLVKGVLMPHTAVRYIRPGESATIDIELNRPKGYEGNFTFELQPETPPEGISYSLADPVIRPHPITPWGEVVPVTVSVAPDAQIGDMFNAYLIARPLGDPKLVASAGIQIRAGESLVSEPLNLPIVIKPYQHENYQFGYAPDYIANEVYFDHNNRPFIRDRSANKYYTGALTTLEDGEWVRRSFWDALGEFYEDFRGIYMGSGFMAAKWAFDGDGGAYSIVRVMRTDNPTVVTLMYTPDRGNTWQFYPLEGNGFDIEQFTGHNATDDPPVVLNYVFREAHEARFCSYNRLQMLLSQKADGRLDLGEPIVISEDCLGSCQHSGAPASTATRDGKTHIVWGEVTDAEAPGVPSYIATYNHATAQLSEKVLLGYGPPVNDVHNVPAVCLDSEGYIHVVTGAHGANFKYRKSLLPNDISGGFTDIVNTLDAGYIDDKTDADGTGRQTYISLVCDDEDSLHIAFRQWRRNADEHWPDQIYAALSTQKKPKDGPWGPAQPMVIPPVPGYSIYYHKLTVDRIGNLYLSYSYWTSTKSYQDDFPEYFHNRAVLVSKDHAQTWKLAETSDFLEVME